MSQIYISKIDVALRQLEVAIRLFKIGGDPVSIHTLACASQEIMETLGKEQGLKSQRLQTLDMIRPERRLEFEKILNKAKNFFKHADRDPKDNLKFNPDSSNFIIWDAEHLYFSLTKEKRPLLTVYDLWVRAKYPDMFTLDVEQKKIHDALFDGLDPENIAHFFQSLLSIVDESSDTGMK